MRRKRGAWIVVAAIVVLQAAAAAQRPTETVLKSVDATVENGLTLVTLDADGALPPTVGRTLDNPARIYFDLTRVVPMRGSATIVRGAGVVTRVRIAQNSPLVTRVVLDLAAHEDFTVKTDPRRPGRLQIVVGGASSLARPDPSAAAVTARPVAPVTPPAARPTSPPVAPPPASVVPMPPPATAAAPVTPVAPPVARPVAPPVAPPPTPTARRQLPRQAASGPSLSTREAARYREQLSGAFERIEARRPVISAIDANAEVPLDVLEAERAHFTDLRRILDAVKPSGAAKSTHDLLISSCTFGAIATGLRIDAARGGDLTARRNSASAAAGSLMLFDRACANLGCPDVPQ